MIKKMIWACKCGCMIISAMLFVQCELDTDGDDASIDNIESTFPNDAAEFGVDVASAINHAIKKFNRDGIDYSDAIEDENFSERFYNDYLNAFPSMKSRSVRQSAFELLSPKSVRTGYANLTTIQKEFVERIISQCGKTASNEEFYEVLQEINQDIKSVVPQIQQCRLFRITAALYFGMREIQMLEQSGYVISTPYREVINIISKSRSESGSGTYEVCRKILATAWAIAVGEPTPAGEIVASVMSVVIGGVMMYEVILCSRKSQSDIVVPDSQREAYCQERYYECTKYPPVIPDGCGMCLQYCMQQGAWPPYETHKCI